VQGLRGELFPYQRKGVGFIEIKEGRALLADEMGLGKTVQALAWLQLHVKKRPAVIVCPASLKLNWAREAQKWMTDPNVEILSGKDPWIPVGDVLIINYDIVSAWIAVLQEMEIKVLILDECHLIKNSAAKRTKAIKQLAKGIPHRIALSGTPIVNKPVEAFNAIKIVNPSVAGNFWDYAQRYCGAHRNGFGWDFNGATNTQELHMKLTNSIMLRRLKKDVLTELPDKTYSFIPIEIDNRKEYTTAEDNFIAFVRATKGKEAAEKANNAAALAEIEGLKQLAVKGKLNQAVQWIEEFLESEDKLVVFTTHTFTIDTLMQKFKDIAVRVDGSTSLKTRQEAVDSFQTNPRCKLFVGNIKAAGVGLTLTAASNVVFLELPWTPGDLQQAEDRCHRIGQKDNVTIYYLLAERSIEERIAHLLDEKKKILSSVLDGRTPETTSLLTELIKAYGSD
jgi:SNF2 family DNA or RNA helicase